MTKLAKKRQIRKPNNPQKCPVSGNLSTWCQVDNIFNFAHADLRAEIEDQVDRMFQRTNLLSFSQDLPQLRATSLFESHRDIDTHSVRKTAIEPVVVAKKVEPGNPFLNMALGVDNVFV